MPDNNDNNPNLNFDKSFSDREKMVVQKKRPLKKLLSTVVMLLLVGGIAMVGYYAYKENAEPVDLSKLNTVKADNSPVKAEPQEPDGEPVANMDKKVYDAISPENQANPAGTATKEADNAGGYEEPINRDLLKEKIESLKNEQAQGNAQEIKPAPSGKPVEQPSAPAAKVDEQAKVEQQVKSEVQTEVHPATEVKPESAAAPGVGVVAPAAPAPKPVEAVKKEKAKVAVKNKNKEAKAPVSRVSSGTYKIQLGAYKTEQEARQAWTALLKKYSGVLGDLTALIHKAEVKEKGIFYRLQAGTIKNEAEAKKLCKKLSESKQDCFVVKN